jgi:uncharacterized membrane protein YeaQ/YmgE (transglycosylase-associated protein family)
MRRVLGVILVLIGLFFGFVGVATTTFGDIDLSTSGKVYVGFIYAVIGAVFLVPGVALVRRGRSRARTD